MRQLMTLTSCLIVILMIVASASAGNLVTNGDFDENVTGWTPFGPSLAVDWNSADYQADPSSGSLLGTNTASVSANYVVTHCVDSVNVGDMYRLTSRVRVPSGQDSDGYAFIFWYWYSDPACSGTQMDNPWSLPIHVADQWTTLPTTPLVAPAGVASAWVVLGVYKTSEGPGTFQVYYDGVEFDEMLFTDGFEMNDTSGWSSTAP